MHSLAGCSWGSLRHQPTVWTPPVCPSSRWVAHVLEKQWTPLYSANSQIRGYLSCPTQSRAATPLTVGLHDCKEGVGRVWMQVCLECLFWWVPGWSAGIGEVGETQMKGTWLHLRALCLWSALLSGLVQQCFRLGQCWITSTWGFPALCVSELQLL